MKVSRNSHVPQVLASEYASFHNEVIQTLFSILLDREQIWSRPLILYDPMAGTAPLIPLAECRGYVAYFNDLNPLHFYVNTAKTAESYIAFKRIGQARLLNIISGLLSELDDCPRKITDEWIQPEVKKIFQSAWKKSENYSKPNTILVKAILLLSIRSFSSIIKTKNPTWIKPGGLRPKTSVAQVLSSAVTRLESFYKHAYSESQPLKQSHIIITCNNALKWKPPSKIDIIITSPPFCNRVDWHRIYAPENFFLQAVGVSIKNDTFLGTTAVCSYPEFDQQLSLVTQHSDYLRKFLAEVQKRQIRNERSSNYYLKYYTRYFAGLFNIFENASNTLGKDHAEIYFVVQDNVHRGLLIEIGQVLAEYLSSQGFSVRPLSIGWDRHHLGLQNISKRFRLIAPKQRESIWRAVR